MIAVISRCGRRPSQVRGLLGGLIHRHEQEKNVQDLSEREADEIVDRLKPREWTTTHAETQETFGRFFFAGLV